jgi:uncharacterized phage protein (predicted DNA packaging)
MTLLERLKANLILDHDDDDQLLTELITAAVCYAEGYQHLARGYYSENQMPASTQQAVIMLSSHFYESRDGSTGGYFSESAKAAEQVWTAVRTLLCMDRAWKV